MNYLPLNLTAFRFPGFLKSCLKGRKNLVDILQVLRVGRNIKGFKGGFDSIFLAPVIIYRPLDVRPFLIIRILQDRLAGGYRLFIVRKTVHHGRSGGKRHTGFQFVLLTLVRVYRGLNPCLF